MSQDWRVTTKNSLIFMTFKNFEIYTSIFSIFLMFETSKFVSKNHLFQSLVRIETFIFDGNLELCLPVL